MKKGIDRRLHPRVPLTLPVVLMTPQETIEGTTVDVGVNGFALILFKEKPEISDEFEITLKTTEDYEMTVTCEKLWSGKIVPRAIVFNGIGVRFTKITASDRQIIAALVEKYYKCYKSNISDDLPPKSWSRF